MELKAFSASINNTASVSLSLKISCIAWIAASAPAYWPAHNWRGPTDLITPFFEIRMIALPAILRRTSPTPIGRKPGFSLSFSTR